MDDLFLQKHIFLSDDDTKYCRVLLYKEKSAMQKAYKDFRSGDQGHESVEGVHCAYEVIEIDEENKESYRPETGTIFLNFESCGAGVVCHEFMHAVLWAWNHRPGKQQYPIIICNITEEEEILYNLSHALVQFYNWYWLVEDQFTEATKAQ
jgi:hypothetical protein